MNTKTPDKMIRPEEFDLPKLKHDAGMEACVMALESLRSLASDPAGSRFTLREIFGTFNAARMEIEGEMAIRALELLAGSKRQTPN